MTAPRRFLGRVRLRPPPPSEIALADRSRRRRKAVTHSPPSATNRRSRSADFVSAPTVRSSERRGERRRLNGPPINIIALRLIRDRRRQPVGRTVGITRGCGLMCTNIDSAGLIPRTTKLDFLQINQKCDPPGRPVTLKIPYGIIHAPAGFALCCCAKPRHGRYEYHARLMLQQGHGGP
jgi:hypothetical protein